MLACKPFSEQTKRVMNSRKRGVIMLIKRLQYFRDDPSESTYSTHDPISVGYLSSQIYRFLSLIGF